METLTLTEAKKTYGLREEHLAVIPVAETYYHKKYKIQVRIFNKEDIEKFIKEKNPNLIKKRIPKKTDIITALWVINRAAKRARDRARAAYERASYFTATKNKEKKEHYYYLKDDVLQVLIYQQEVNFIEFHKIGGCYFEVWEKNGKTFHIPTEKRFTDGNFKKLKIEEITSKAKEKGEPPITVAKKTIQEFLKENILPSRGISSPKMQREHECAIAENELWEESQAVAQ